MVRQASKAGANAGQWPMAKVDTKASSLATSSPMAKNGTPPKEVPLRTSDLALGSVVRWTVKSLYCEEVLPRGPLLQWLLSMLLGVKLGHKDLRELIEAEEGLCMDPPDSRKLNFNALLEEEPPGFKGFVSDSEVAMELSEENWEEAAICLSQGGWPEAEDTAHKFYVVASWLQDVSEMYQSWSYGRVLAVIRFAAQSDCLLGHRSGLLVPYEHSEECERRVNAWTGLPTHIKDGEAYVKTWEELQECLFRLLLDRQIDVLEVSKLKLMFRTELSLELSETVFGHQCLSRLLADPRLGDDFLLETCQGNRYMVRLRPQLKAKQTSHRTAPRDKPAGSAAVPVKKKPPAPKNSSGDVPAPPGLSLPEEPGGSSSPPPMDMASWPTLSDVAKGEAAKGETPVNNAFVPPPGLTPEKPEKKADAPAPSSAKVPSSRMSKEKIKEKIRASV